MDRNRPGRVEDYTRPALIMAGVNLFLFLAIVWANFGLPLCLLIAAVLNAVIPRRGDA